MPTSTLMIAVNWYGPFSSFKSARDEARKAGVLVCLYLAVSKRGKLRSYGGLSGNIATRLNKRHHVLRTFPEENMGLWVGTIASQSEAGRKSAGGPRLHSRKLHMAEHMTAYFLETSENDRKRYKRPGRSAVLLNRWFKPTGPWARHTKRGHPNWPDLIEFEAEEKFARKVWFGGKSKTMNDKQIEKLKLQRA